MNDKERREFVARIRQRVREDKRILDRLKEWDDVLPDYNCKFSTPDCDLERGKRHE